MGKNEEVRRINEYVVHVLYASRHMCVRVEEAGGEDNELYHHTVQIDKEFWTRTKELIINKYNYEFWSRVWWRQTEDA